MIMAKMLLRMLLQPVYLTGRVFREKFTVTGLALLIGYLRIVFL
jgi:hypothetical protein